MRLRSLLWLFISLVVGLGACTDGQDRPVDVTAVVDADATTVDALSDAQLTPNTLGLSSVSPTIGSVKGGTVLDLVGTGFSPSMVISVGGIGCGSLLVSSSTTASCTTGDSDFVEGVADVVAADATGDASLIGAFTYQCPWTTSLGRRSCGAVPPSRTFATQSIAAWVTQMQTGHGFVTNAGAGNLNDVSDAFLGTQSAFIVTDGQGTARTITRTNLPPIDFTSSVPRIWVKLDEVVHARTFS